MSTKQKNCLVTGAAGGIGMSLTQIFMNAGYQVIATDCLPKPESLCCTSYFQCDLQKLVQDEQYANSIFTIIRNLLNNDSLDVLINNAAIQILGNTQSITRRDWQKTLDTNLTAPFFLIQGLLNELEKGQSGVINIGSIHARLTKQNFVAYATSKAALAGMTRSLAVDLGSRLRINTIEPAAVETDMLKAGFINSPELYEKLKQHHPVQRIATTDEIAHLVLMLAENRTCFMTGSILSIDGGISSRLHDPD